jgi:uncharacterized membrane protein YuzA (DUF378 family)
MRRHRNPLDEMNGLDRTAGALIAAGALNWGVVGATNFDPVRAVLGRSAAARVVYGLVGVSAAYALARGSQLTRH